MLMVPLRQLRLAHGVDPKDSPGRAILEFYGNPSAASAILVVESIHGVVDAGSPCIGIKFQCLAKRDQTVVWENLCAKAKMTLYNPSGPVVSAFKFQHLFL